MTNQKWLKPGVGWVSDVLAVVEAGAQVLADLELLAALVVLAEQRDDLLVPVTKSQNRWIFVEFNQTSLVRLTPTRESLLSKQLHFDFCLSAFTEGGAAHPNDHRSRSEVRIAAAAQAREKACWQCRGEATTMQQWSKKKTTLRKWKEPTAKCNQNCERSFLNKKE